MKTSELLIEARQRLVDYGWCQGLYISGDGTMCAMGALKPFSDNTTFLAIDALENVLPGTNDSLTTWNDRPERTKEQVLELYDHAISAAMSDEAAE